MLKVALSLSVHSALHADALYLNIAIEFLNLFFHCFLHQQCPKVPFWSPAMPYCIKALAVRTDRQELKDIQYVRTLYEQSLRIICSVFDVLKGLFSTTLWSYFCLRIKGILFSAFGDITSVISVFSKTVMLLFKKKVPSWVLRFYQLIFMCFVS